MSIPIEVQFLIAGDGPKRQLLEDTRENFNLDDRIKLLGTIEHSKINDVLTRGQIFLNTSLTEAFCMAIVEAACCGLQVVSTKVGGLPEVLPPELIYFAEPEVHHLVECVDTAIRNVQGNSLEKPEIRHSMVKEFYSWKDVTERTTKVYANVTHTYKRKRLGEQLRNYFRGSAFNPFPLLIILMYIMLMVCDWLEPRKNIDIAKCTIVREKVRRDAAECTIIEKS